MTFKTSNLSRATIFSSVPFCRAWAESYGMRWESLDFEHSLGATYLIQKLFLREYHLSAHGLSWGSTETSPNSFEPFLSLVTKLSKRWNSHLIQWNFGHDAWNALQSISLKLQPSTITEKYIHLLPLQGENADQYLGHLAKPVTRRQVKIGNDAGVTVRRLSTDIDFDQHEFLYRSWAQSKEVGYRPLQLFRKLNSELPHSFLLLGAFKDGKMIAAISVFYDDLEWLYWHGARDMQNDKFFATDVLLDYAIRSALESGAKHFNMGGSGGIPSLEAYKERWGAKKTPIWRLQWKNRLWSKFIRLSQREFWSSKKG